MDPNLERARDELRAATDGAQRDVRTKLQALDVGIFEEESGDRTPDDPGPKTDRVAEIHDTLGGLAAEAEGATADQIEAARAAIESYMEAHPHGG